MKRYLILWCMTICATVCTWAQSAAVVPDDATQEDWTVTFLFHYNGTSGEETSTEQETMKVAFSGQDVYFHLPNPFAGNTWVKGTISGATATFAINQYIGNYSGAVYMAGLGEQGLCDVVFSYDAEAGVFALADMYLLLNSSQTVSNPWAYYSDMTVRRSGGTTPGEPVVTDPVVVAPEGLVTEEWAFQASRLLYDYTTESVSHGVRLGQAGNSVFIQGLFRELPYAWLQGTRDSEGELTLPSGQYYGPYNDYGRTIHFYFAGADYPTTNPTWADAVEWSYDAATETYQAHSLVALNSSKTTLAAYDLYAGAKLVKVKDVVATPANPVVLGTLPYDAQYGYGAIYLDIPTLSVTGAPILMDKLSYRLYTETDGKVEDFVFRNAVYRDLPQSSMTIIPYTYDDQFDITLGGNFIALYDPQPAYSRMGVQSIYTGGGEEHASDIVWFSLDPAGITPTKAELRVESVSYTDMQGRPATAHTPGIILRTEHLSDGSVRTQKVVGHR